MEQAELTTPRLILRPFEASDADAITRLAGDRAIAAMTRRIPHPYERRHAEEWLAALPEKAARGEEFAWAVMLRACGMLIGSAGLRFHADDERGELGYWIGRPYWSRGYCTEAATELVRYGFAELRLNRIHACCLARNRASAYVLRKLGLAYEGCARQHFKKWGRFEDVETYGALRAEHGAWPAPSAPAAPDGESRVGEAFDAGAAPAGVFSKVLQAGRTR